MSNNQSPEQQLEALIIDNPQLEQLEDLIAEFNIFEAVGSVRQELRHSDFLAFMLNPHEKHGLGDYVLKKFLIRVLSDANSDTRSPLMIDITDLSNVTVERESQNIDLLIHDEQAEFVCLIENKIFSDEHSNQLNRYLQIVNGRFPAIKPIPIFLTPDGISPEDEDSPYIPVSYGQVADIMEQVRQTKESMLGVDVNTTIRHYVAMLRRYIVSDSDIAKLCQKIYRSHRAAIDLIIEHMPDLRQEVAGYLSKIVNENTSLVLIHGSKSYLQFVPNTWKTVPEFNMGDGSWSKDQSTLLFEFSNASDQLKLSLLLGPVDDDNTHIRKAIFAHADANRDVFKGCRANLTGKWLTIYKLPLLSKSNYEDASLDDLVEIITKKWGKFLDNDLPKITDSLMTIDFSQE